MNRFLSSGRSQQRLMELHRAISTSVNVLNQHHSVLVGAILGCDASTQQRVLDEHRALIASAMDTLARLASFAEQCRVGMTPQQSGLDTLVDADGNPTPCLR